MDKQKNNEQIISTPTYPEGHEYPAAIEKKKKVGPRKSITITFRENRTFELNLGHETMRFEGRETKSVDKELLKHPAFIQARKYFNIKGI